MVLVAFGTRYGSTEKVALEIASFLRRMEHQVEILDLRLPHDIELDHYDLIVIGSGIVYGSWSEGALRFLEKNSKALIEKKLAMFVCCGDLMLDPSRADEYRQRYLRNVADRYGLRPIDMGLFGGVLDFSKYSFLVKGILKVDDHGGSDPEQSNNPSAVYDLRDWAAILRWASELDGVM
ncbi:MAG: hypothetical protein MIO90_01985 [Methanomassiliicoccales archaeon]|nr:hypothetical protein [Methanomassiliicoccales archaeon]